VIPSQGPLRRHGFPRADADGFRDRLHGDHQEPVTKEAIREAMLGAANGRMKGSFR